jgi:hypothetical protein
MRTWLFFALLTITFWSCMGFIGKLASRTVSAQGMPAYAALGGAVVLSPNPMKNIAPSLNASYGPC